MRHWVVIFCALLALSCGDGTEADELGVGAECSSNDDCNTDEDHQCLGFKGGYCGVPDCESDEDCPEASKCVQHTDGNPYCFRVCVDKSECNANRSGEFEANCSSSVTFVDDENGIKACVPPS